MKKAAAYPYIVWAVIFTVIPLILVVYYSLTLDTPDGIIFTTRHFQRAFEPIFLKVMWRSVKLALYCTFFCFIIGYPVAYIMADREMKIKSAVLFLFLVPMWMNFLLRTYAWLTILEKNGIINSILAAVGLPKLNLLYNDQAVVLGMVYNFLPFMVLPIYTVLKKMDFSIIEAAQDLGADAKQIFLRVVFPLSLPGVISGITMVFMPAVTTFIVSNLLGGGQFILIGNLIEQQFLRTGDWNFGSAISVILLIIILISMGIFSMVDEEGESGGLF